MEDGDFGVATHRSHVYPEQLCGVRSKERTDVESYVQ
jgi:hypothetical protein